MSFHLSQFDHSEIFHAGTPRERLSTEMVLIFYEQIESTELTAWFNWEQKAPDSDR